MPEHDRFEELCAVAAIGQLSEEELSELAEHLKSCYTCRRTAGEFACLLKQLPMGEVDLDERSTVEVLSTSHRERFLSRARSEGVEFSRMAEEGEVQRWNWLPKLRPLLRFAGPVFVTAGIMIVVLPFLLRQNTDTLNVTFKPPALASDVLGRGEQHPVANSARIDSLSADNNRLHLELAHAQLEASRARKEADTAIARAQEADNQLHNFRGELDQVVAEADRLRTSRDAASAEIVAQQYRLNSLNEQIKNEQASAEQDRQLTGAAREVRELMGARNLHIIDVFDADGSGKPKKSFGRVFYVEGKSLIFYAFDLKQKSSGSAKVSFQAWGQRGSTRDKPRSLGVFYVDDHAQGRWVLKVEDPAKLAAIDSVFVTVEPLGGADRPTGEKLLYAFLGNYANHP